MQEDKDPSKGKGEDDDDEKKLKAPSSPKPRSPSPKPRSPKMAQLALPDEQGKSIKESPKRDSDISDSGLPTLPGIENREAARPENLYVDPVSDLAIHGSLNFRTPSPEPSNLYSTRGNREAKFEPIEQTDHPLFPKCSPRKKASELPATKDSPDLSSATEDLSSLPDVIQTSKWTVPELPLEVSSDTDQLTDSAEVTIESPDIPQSSLQQSLSPDDEQAIGCFSSLSLNPSKKSDSGKEQVSDGSESALPSDIPQRQQQRSQSPMKENLCRSLMLRPHSLPAAEVVSDDNITSLGVPQKSPKRSPMKEFLSTLSMKSCMSRQESTSGTEEDSDTANATSLNIPQRSPQKSPSSVKEQVSKLFGRKRRSPGPKEESRSEATSLIPGHLLQSQSPTEEQASKHSTSGDKQESQSTSKFVVPKGVVRSPKQSPSWIRSSSSSPLKRSQKPFYETLYMERAYRTSTLEGYQSDNSAHPVDRPSNMGASGYQPQVGPVDVNRQANRPLKQNSSSSDDEFFSRTNLDHMDKMRRLTQDSRSRRERGETETTSSITLDSEMGATSSTFSVDSVFERDTQEPRLDGVMPEKQAPPEEDVDRQGKRSSNQDDPSPD